MYLLNLNINKLIYLIIKYFIIINLILYLIIYIKLINLNIISLNLSFKLNNLKIMNNDYKIENFYLYFLKSKCKYFNLLLIKIKF